MSKSPVRIRLSLLHAAFDEGRRATFARLYEQLLEECRGLEDEVDLHVYRELSPRGGTLPWLEMLQHGIDRADVEGIVGGPRELDAARALGRFAPTHLSVLPDDVVLGKNFVRGLLALVKAQPNEILCGLATHAFAPEARRLGHTLYRTPDAFANFAGTLPIEFAKQHLTWRERAIERGVHLEGDQGVFTHLMSIGRGCLKTVPSLVDHIDADRTLDGSNVAEDQPRRALVFEPETDLATVDWTKPVVDVGRTTRGNHWRTFYDLNADEWDIEATYRLDRDANVATIESPEGRLQRNAFLNVFEKETVLIAVPEYRGMVNECRFSMNACAKALEAAGIPVEIRSFPGQSLVTRARNIIAHVFLTTRHTILFQWDDDVECRDPDALVKMVKTKRDVLGGAYPFRDGSGGVVVGPLPKKDGKPGEFEVHVEDDGTCSVREVATGFLLVRRHVLTTLMQKHPELLCQIDGGGPELRGAPHWALFDTRIDPDGIGHRRRYLSEDWTFSRRCREAGFDPRVFVPPILRHWGMAGSDGHCSVQWGLATKEQVYGAGR
jgi:hypothetical protein